VRCVCHFVYFHVSLLPRTSSGAVMHPDPFVDSATIYIVCLLTELPTYLLSYLLIYFLKNRPVPFPGRTS